MTVKNHTLMEALADLCKEAIDEKRHHDALMISLIAYLEARARKDNVSADGALGIIFSTANKLRQGSPLKRECSFCGRLPPKVKLTGGGGYKAYICNKCVDMLHADFHSKDGKKD